MKVAFFSNFLNHHQLPFSQAMVKLTQGQYTFVATTPVPNQRLELGYHNMNDAFPFVLKTYEDPENEKKAYQLAEECDIVIIGSAPSEFVHERILSGKLTFHYSERFYKSGFFAPRKLRGIPILWPNFLMLKRKNWLWNTHGQYKKCSNLYMLCASAYTAGDLWLSGLYRGKTYKWGYFPEVKQQNIEVLLANKGSDCIEITWVGRLIDWKHPEEAIYVAEKLKKNGYHFHLNIIGNGKMQQQLFDMVAEYKLEGTVSLLGAMPPEKVREYMERSDIFLFTSDFNEGWGAVLNEAMNSGCAVVSSDAIGSTDFLISDGVNGLKYRNGSQRDLYNKVSFLIEHPEKRKTFAENAYKTLIKEWNAEEAARRVIALSERLEKGENTEYLTGPCSAAKPIIRGFILQNAKG